MARRGYKGSSVATSLSAGITSGDTTIALVDGSSLPSGSAPFVVTIDLGLAGEEKVLAGGRTGNNLTSCTRGYDGTSAADHSSGATVRHTISAVDLDEANAHVNASTGVHGIAGAVVGTTDAQTLTNKIITQAQTHYSPDTDVSASSIHHTLGTGANQAAAGNHTHSSGVMSNLGGAAQFQAGTDSATITAALTGTDSVTFGTAFTNTPKVFVEINSPAPTGGLNFVHAVTSVSTTGFTVTFTRSDGGVIATTAITYSWFAVGS